MPILTTDYFSRPAKKVARDLVATYLVRKHKEGEVVRWMITETEAYVGPHDEACHARFGRTKRTEVMYGEPGTMYVYLIYGMYDMLNIVTDEKGYPAAVLIRGIRKIGEEGGVELDGPGKLTRALEITKEEHNKRELGKKAGVWIESRDTEFDPKAIKATARVGIDYAGEWKDKHLRFVLENLGF